MSGHAVMQAAIEPGLERMLGSMRRDERVCVTIIPVADRLSDVIDRLGGMGIGLGNGQANYGLGVIIGVGMTAAQVLGLAEYKHVAGIIPYSDK